MLTHLFHTLKSACPDYSLHDYRLMIQWITGLSPNQQRTETFIPDPKSASRTAELIARLNDGEPLPYILGVWDFMDLNLIVHSATLIPRPDTETLIFTALNYLPDDGVAIDLGTGTGIIALTLAQHRPNALIMAIDASEEALQTARLNAQRNGIENVVFAYSDWLTGCPDDCADVIASNPPYLADDDPHLPDLSFEPRSALVASENGYGDLFAIIREAPRVLKSGGFLCLEHGYEQALGVQNNFHRHGWTNIQTVKDMAGRDRVTYAKKPE